MKREYIIRGKKITIEELDTILAVLPSKKDAESRGKIEKMAGQSIDRKNLKLKDSEVTEKNWNAFEKAGWIFVQASEDLRKASGSSQFTDANIGRVFLHPSGRVLIGTGRMTIKLKPELSNEEARAKINAVGAEIINELKFNPNLFEVITKPGVDFLQLSVDLHDNKDFLYAEPQFIQNIESRFAPTDPDYGQQWHLKNIGQNSGTAGADISAEKAWDVTKGNGIRLSVVDNGFDVNHKDLSAAVLAESGFFMNDGMGGANFTQGLAGYPGSSHGTFCAGMAIARQNNAEGGSGVAPEAGFLAVACLGDQTGTQATLARALVYAADPSQEVPALSPNDGADVISCSLGPNGADWEMESVMQNAIDFVVTNGRNGLGTPIFWAVTNGNFEIRFDEVCSYANVIAVGRSTRNDLEDNCGFGPELQFLATGVDVHSTSPGDAYTDSTGTSFAAPTAAGVGALALAVNPDLTWTQLRDIMRASCDKIGGNIYDAAGHNDDYGFGRVNAARTVCEAGYVVNLETSTVQFKDIPEGEPSAAAIVFSVHTCHTATFQIIAGPSVTSGPGSFGTLTSPSSSLPVATSAGFREARLWLSFVGIAAGDITQGSVTVQLLETGEQWVIPITANTIEKPTVASIMVLDQSNSMTFNSGIPSLPHRIDVLKFAAPVFVDLLFPDDGIGVAAFDHDGYPRMDVQKVVFDSPIDAAKSSASGQIIAHTPNPMGNTAIGDGLEVAHNLLDDETGYMDKAIVVFTDGFETAGKYISDVAGLINERVFAIGLGTADQIQPAALTSLTNDTGGYLLLTGNMTSDDVFKLSKYFLQILAGVTNDQVVLDPEGFVAPGQEKRIPFYLNEADYRCDVILLTDAQVPVFKFWLETPAGDKIFPGTAGTSYITGKRSTYYRFNLPVAIGAGAHSGKWNAVLAIDEKYLKRYLASLDDKNKKLYQSILAHGIRYNLNVHASSVLSMKARIHQNSLEPGADITIRAILTEYGAPIPKNRATVYAHLVYPDNSKTLVVLKATAADSGVYEATVKANINGVYSFRVMAYGSTWRGRKYSREQLLTGAVWRGGNQPPPSSKDQPSTTTQWCELLSCLFNSKVLSDDLLKKWQAQGLNIEYLKKCLAKWCREKTTGVKVNSLKAQLSAIAYLDPSRQQSELVKIVSDMTETEIKELAGTLSDPCDCKK